MINNINIDKCGLMKLGYKEYTATTIIRQAKQYMVKQGYPFYSNKRLGMVPIHAVESIIGASLQKLKKDED